MDDKAAIDRVTKCFYSLFTNRGGTAANVARINELFIAKGVIVKTCGELPVVYDLNGFIEPRERLLRDGELVEFEEEEVRERTSIMGYVAQRLSAYRKSGILRGEPFEGRGIKTMQFVCANGAWKLSAVAWDDERDGFALDLSDF
ncbi:MAG: DUF4440 domain-containing protein [Candidatus Eremiobacteraeota bacterium]|nr:DUF4440 domain-containing protein [Candidatus Eremiobacteraeota bacterium]